MKGGRESHRSLQPTGPLTSLLSQEVQRPTQDVKKQLFLDQLPSSVHRPSHITSSDGSSKANPRSLKTSFPLRSAFLCEQTHDTTNARSFDWFSTSLITTQRLVETRGVVWGGISPPPVRYISLHSSHGSSPMFTRLPSHPAFPFNSSMNLSNVQS